MKNMEDIFYPSEDGKHTVHACVWRPEGEVKGAVQIIHGMSEYAERYAPFAEYLNAHGYIVCADDHLGHGKTAENAEDFGYFDDAKNYMTVIHESVNDFDEIIVSGGKIGVQILLSPIDLIQVTGAVTGDIIVKKE